MDARPGRGAIDFERCGAATVLRTMRATSPLKLLAPRNHGRGAWVFVATFGGGLVAGDAIHLEVGVGPEACALLGTQASTKVYRCAEATSRQEVRARVDRGGLLVLVPDPVVCYAGARYEQATHVDLAEGASLVLLEMFTAGRSARGERWDFQRCGSRMTIARGGAPLVVDAVVLDPAHGDLRARMGRFDALATLVLVGPLVRAMREAALATKRPLVRAADLRASASAIGEDAAIVRIAGTSVESVTAAARAHLDGLAAVLGDDPFARKW
jgi:urease accessory protein